MGITANSRILQPREMATRSRNEGVGALGDAFHQVAQGLTRVQEALRLHEQEAQRRLQEALRLQEERAAAALRQMEQQLRGRDDAISALRHSLGERVQRLEARLAAVEEQMRSSSARRDSEGAREQEHDVTQHLDEPKPQIGKRKRSSSEGTESEGARDQVGRLDNRMGKLEEAVQRALASVFPRVEALVERLEASPPGAPLSPSPLASTSPAPQPPAANVIPGASEEAADDDDDDVDRLRQQLVRRMVEVRRRTLRSAVTPSPLGVALCNAIDPDEARCLLDAGADVNYTNTFGHCPLTSAILVDFPWADDIPEVVSILLARGADPNAIDEEGRSALHLAVLERDLPCVARLITAGADVDARDWNGATPLHLAASSDHERIVRRLVTAGADKSLKGWSGFYENKTPSDVAIRSSTRNLLRP